MFSNWPCIISADGKQINGYTDQHLGRENLMEFEKSPTVKEQTERLDIVR